MRSDYYQKMIIADSEDINTYLEQLQSIGQEEGAKPKGFLQSSADLLRQICTIMEKELVLRILCYTEVAPETPGSAGLLEVLFLTTGSAPGLCLISGHGYNNIEMIRIHILPELSFEQESAVKNWISRISAPPTALLNSTVSTWQEQVGGDDYERVPLKYNNPEMVFAPWVSPFVFPPPKITEPFVRGMVRYLRFAFGYRGTPAIYYKGIASFLGADRRWIIFGFAKPEEINLHARRIWIGDDLYNTLPVDLMGRQYECVYLVGGDIKISPMPSDVYQVPAFAPSVFLRVEQDQTGMWKTCFDSACLIIAKDPKTALSPAETINNILSYQFSQQKIREVVRKVWPHIIPAF